MCLKFAWFGCCPQDDDAAYSPGGQHYCAAEPAAAVAAAAAAPAPGPGLRRGAGTRDNGYGSTAGGVVRAATHGVHVFGTTRRNI